MGRWPRYPPYPGSFPKRYGSGRDGSGSFIYRGIRHTDSDQIVGGKRRQRSRDSVQHQQRTRCAARSCHYNYDGHAIIAPAILWIASRLRGHWEGILGALAGAWGWFFLTSKQDAERIDQAADAVHQQVTRMVLEQGAAAAHLKVQQTYDKELNDLNGEEAANVASLMHDPAAMARYIVQLTGSAQFPAPPTPPPEDPPS